jgi:hypothetical protein
MAQKKGNHIPESLQTGNDFVDFARGKGAHVKKAGKFMAVETGMGKVKIAPSNYKLDNQTRHNLWHWFKLLGIIISIILFAPFLLHFVGMV